MPDDIDRWTLSSLIEHDERGLGPKTSLIIGEGEMAVRTRRLNWGNTSLGPIGKWSETLLSTVNLLLAARHPMFLFWGPDHIQFYNDGYRPTIRDDKHPAALGQRGFECWPEIWPVIGPQIEEAMARGGATFHLNQLVPISRDGKLEEVFWTYGYSPVRGRANNVEGVLVICTDTTKEVLSERRLSVLSALYAESLIQRQPADAQSLLTLAKTIMSILGRNPADFPFAALYLVSPSGIVLAGSTVSIGDLAHPNHWPLAKVLESSASRMVEELDERFEGMICEPWPEPVTHACLFPLRISGLPSQAALVIGASPRLPLDDVYISALQLVGDRIANLLQGEVLQMERAEREKTLQQQATVLAERAALLDLARDAIIVRDMQDHILFWNRGAEGIYGWSSHEAIGQDTFDLLRTKSSGDASEAKAILIRQGHWEGEAHQQRRDGTHLIVSRRSALQSDANGEPIRILTIDNEITARKQAESNLRSLTERLSLATAVARVGVWEWDLIGNSFVWDATMFETYNFLNAVPIPYKTWAAAVHPEDLPRVEAALRKVIDEKCRGSIEFRIVLLDGTLKNISAEQGVVLDESGNVRGVIGVNIDVTARVKSEEALRKSQAEMTHLAAHDFLTGLPNRMLLNDRITQALGPAQRNGKYIAVMFLDLDGFKYINDSLGHSVGDKLLQSVARKLVSCVRGSDTVSRQGGDEFIVLLSEVDHPKDAAITAKRMLAALAEPHSINGQDLHITASIGLSFHPGDGLDAEELIKNADLAMYQAKEAGRDGVQFFTQEMNIRAVERQSIESNLRRALERREFAVHYQPRINLKTGEIAGAEALVRWTHPNRGLISPAQFIPVAEDCGLILPIGNWVVHEACRQAQAWTDAGRSLGTMSVNISAKEFRDEHFLSGLLATLEETGLDPKSLELELSENVLMKGGGSVECLLSSLRAIGVRLVIDDFGTGYSSLSYLSRFPVDALKIDQSFAGKTTTNASEAIIVKTIVNMGRNLGLRVVAEGVETMEYLAFLLANECDEGQGYYFSNPLPPQQFTEFLDARLREPAHNSGD